MRRLVELNPNMIGDVLILDCPCGVCVSRIRVHVGKKQEKRGEVCYWSMEGEFPDTLSLAPSIRVTPSKEDQCLGWKGWIIKGMVTDSNLPAPKGTDAPD